MIFFALSPNRRTLLLEQDVYACGTSRQGYFLPAGGGSLQPVVGDASTQSEPVGWLSDGSALVAAQSDASCEGVPVAGISYGYPDMVRGLLDDQVAHGALSRPDLTAAVVRRITSAG